MELIQILELFDVGRLFICRLMFSNDSFRDGADNYSKIKAQIKPK